MKQIATLQENVFKGHWIIIIGLTFKPVKS